MSAEILIVDDEADIRNLIQGILEDEGYSVSSAKNSDEAYTRVKEKRPALVVLDIWLQGSKDDGLAILQNLKKEYPDLPIVMISGHGTIETAVAAIRDGAYDFIEKPFKSDRLLLMIGRALENAKLKKENAALKKQTLGSGGSLIGNSSVIQNIQQVIDRVAPTNSRILLSGEPGTGKDIVARLIHKKSSRADEAFVVMNCATLRPERFEVELFGSVDGEQIGVLEQAHKGTLLLDEVSDMPLETQGKIVRVLQEQRFQKVGDHQKIDVDVRVLATTNRNLEELMNAGSFRQDLYYRLNVVPISMPALRERAQDIPFLVEFFLSGFVEQLGLTAKSFSVSALNILKKYKWPGNIRQLRNVIEWVVIMNANASLDVFDVEHLPPDLSGVLPQAPVSGNAKPLDGEYLDLPLREAREVFEREYLLAQVNKFDGNVSKTAQFVGMERSALHRKLKTLQIGFEKEESVDTETFSNKKRA